MKWLGLALERHASCELLAFNIDHVYTPLMLGLDSFEKQYGLPYQVEFNHRLLGLCLFIAHMVQTIMIGPSVGLELIVVQTTAKHMHNAMQFTWTDLRVGSMGFYNMGRR